MQLKKGTSIIDVSGNIYTLTGLDIRNQIVKHTVSVPGHEPVPGQMLVSQWKELASTPNTLDAAGIVNKVQEFGNRADITVDVMANQPQFLISKGMLFQMMDRSRWKIREYNRDTKMLVAVNEKNEKPQDFTLDEITMLVNDGHIKILS